MGCNYERVSQGRSAWWRSWAVSWLSPWSQELIPVNSIHTLTHGHVRAHECGETSNQVCFCPRGICDPYRRLGGRCVKWRQDFSVLFCSTLWICKYFRIKLQNVWFNNTRCASLNRETHLETGFSASAPRTSRDGQASVVGWFCAGQFIWQLLWPPPTTWQSYYSWISNNQKYLQPLSCVPCVAKSKPPLYKNQWYRGTSGILESDSSFYKRSWHRILLHG